MENRRDRWGRRQPRRNPSQRKFQRPKGIIDGADFISSMPDDILHHILFFIPIDLAMRTSVLSRRWRHVWFAMPCLAIDEYILIKAAGGVNQTLASYTASFKLRMRLDNTLPPPLIDSLVEFAISRNVEKLSCKLGQESTDNILSGCPVLESLTLYACRSLERLDLRKSLIYADKQCTLTDVSSLTEAHLYIRINILLDSTAHCFQTLALELLAKLHNILSLAELRGDPFPTEFAQSVPGIARLLQNSPGLKKLTVYMMHGYNIMSRNLDQYWELKYKVFAPSNDSYSMLGCNVATSKVLAWFMELVLRNAKTLENMVVWLRSRYFDDAQWFEEQLQIVGTLSHNNNVSILLKRKNF
ncbi:hypothetical protein F2Q70_00006843 [Brassica cretica]|uniref:F-box domain-containing protein n=1 Tax=Brassica cretica TaxID=69181 RepID=A0A8S9IW41_BRACR|nr:hypothetical protein F2Q68_00023514 [Brassica cretica]KAF2573236.1 hypothetical protein F2Q70_00006843 [Brassica cretica]